MKPKKPLKQKTILVIFELFIYLVLLEVGLRIGGGIFLSLQEYRNRVSIKQKGEYRIMCLGESITATGGKNSYPAQLEEILNERNIGLNFSVINKGIPGASTSYILNVLEERLNRYKPDMVITMMGVSDDGAVLVDGYRTSLRIKTMLFLEDFRVYKLVKIIWSHIADKMKEIGIYKPKEKIQNYINNLVSPPYYYTEREETLKKALELNPRSDSVYVRLGWVYRDQGKFTQAEELFKKALELNPRSDSACLGLGVVYRDQGKFTQAEELFKKALELNPNSVIACLGLEWAYINQGKFTQAEELFKKALELNPNSVIACLGLEWAYINQGKFTQAEELFKKGIETNPDKATLYGGLAVVYNEMGKYESAQECYEKANKLRLVEYYNSITWHNYRKLKEILDKRDIRLVCVQYPMCSIEPLKKIFEGEGGVTFVDNERVFKEALKKASYKEYFIDIIGGDFGHLTPKGNRLLAENIANIILKRYFNK